MSSSVTKETANMAADGGVILKTSSDAMRVLAYFSIAVIYFFYWTVLF